MKRITFFLSLTLLILFGQSFQLPFLNAAETSSQRIPAGDAGQKWAFCVGVGDYADPRIIDLPKARNDAKGLARVLEERGAFDHIVLFTDDLDKKDPHYPSKKNIQAALKAYAGRIDSQDMVFIAFSGHGIASPSGRSLLVSADTRLGGIEATGLPLDVFTAFLKKTGVKRGVIFLDACRERITQQEDLFIQGIYPDRYLKRGVTAIFYAARKGSYSHDHEDSEYGVFMREVIAGLEGEGDTRYGGNNDGVVSIGELAGYVREGVTAWSGGKGKTQRPYIKILARGMEDMVLTSVVPVEPGRPSVAGPVPSEKGVSPEREEAQKIDRPAVREQPEVTEKVETRDGEDLESKAAVKEAAQVQAPGVKTKEEVRVAAPAPTIEEVMEKGQAEVPAGMASEEGSMAPQGIKTEGDQERVEGIAGQSEAQVAAEIPSAAEAVEEGAGPKRIEAAEGPTGQKKPTEAGETPRESDTEKEPKGGESLQVAAVPQEKAIEPLNLRKEGKALIPEEVRSMLYTYAFYATCWNYNGDFCNPEGDFENNFQDNQDGTVTDRASRLMWQKGGSSRPMTWQDAKAYAEKINREGLGGYSDWRLPTVEELASLMESSWKNSDLFIDPVFDKTQRYCWSMDTRDRDRAWKANYHMGFFLDFPMTAENSVRLVRSLPR
jgi:hypothetical protein